MSHHSLPKKWRRSAVTVVLVPSLMCGGHAVVAPTASAAPASSAGSSNVGSTGSAALPGIPDNIIRLPHLPQLQHQHESLPQRLGRGHHQRVAAANNPQHQC